MSNMLTFFNVSVKTKSENVVDRNAKDAGVNAETEHVSHCYDATSKLETDEQGLPVEAHKKAAEFLTNASPHLTRQQERMRRNIGKKVRKVLFLHGEHGRTDRCKGEVKHVTAYNRYHEIYTDMETEEMTETDFKKFSASTSAQSSA